MLRRISLLILFAVCLLRTPSTVAAQKHRESAIARARVAAVLRDSLLKIDGNVANGLRTAQVTDSDDLGEFLIDPFDSGVENVPTLNQLDGALAQVNLVLKNKNKVTTPGQQGATASDISPGVGMIGNGLLGSLGLPSEAQLITGLTDFMVTRAKDEVAFSFVLNLRNQVRDDRWIRIGLPSSYRLMQRVDLETYQSFLPVLRSAFVEDMNMLPARANVLADSLGVNGNYLRGVTIAYQRGLEIRRGSPPAVALANLANLDSGQMPDSISRRALQLIGLVAREYSAGGGEIFAQEVVRADRGWLRRYLVGFLARDAIVADHIEDDFVQANMLDFLSSREADVVLVVNQLDAMRELLRDVRQNLQTIARDSSQSNDASDRTLAMAGAVLQVMNTGQRFLYWGNGTEPKEVRDFREFIADATTLHQAFIKHDYASLVTWAVQRPELKLCQQDAEAFIRERDRLRGEVVAGRPEANQAEVDAMVRQRLPANLLREAAAGRVECVNRTRFLSFAATLASARSSREVSVALREASAPVGSFRAKRNQFNPSDETSDRRRWHPTSASIVGYLGVTGGLEEEGRFPGRSTRAKHFGAALPIGVEVSQGFPGGALSLFAPVIDVGTLASAQLGGDDAESSSPTLRQIIAPGLFLVWNISRTVPFSVGAGAQLVPELRERDGERVDVVRASVFVGVDVTIFNFRL